MENKLYADNKMFIYFISHLAIEPPASKQIISSHQTDQDHHCINHVGICLSDPSVSFSQMWMSVRTGCTDVGRASTASIWPAHTAVNARRATSMTHSGGCV